MPHFSSPPEKVVLPSFSPLRHKGGVRAIISVLYILLVCCILAACSGSTPPTTAKTGTPQPSAAATATPSPTPTQAPTPTLAPTPTPKPTTPPPPPPPPPTQPPVNQIPPILDLTPASMFIGASGCGKSGGFYICSQPVVTNRSNFKSMGWSTSANVGGISFSPASGTLAPGQSVRITVSIRISGCANGTLFFRGPLNTHTITWNCNF